MRDLLTFRAASIAALAIGLLASPAFADVYTTTTAVDGSIGQSDNPGITISAPGFDSSLGTVTGVEATWSGSLVATIQWGDVVDNGAPAQGGNRLR
jgi:hypothetical protein